MKFVLVTGCPRSGTTPLTGWLGMSPNVVSLCESRRTLAMHRLLDEARRFKTTSGELATIKSCAGMMMRKLYDTGVAVVVDKEPLEPIAFPHGDFESYLDDVVDVLDSKLLFMIRDPVTTVFEILSRLWGHSRVAGEPEKRTLPEAIAIWREATETAIKYAGRENVRLQSYEKLVVDSPHQSIYICDFVGATLPSVEFPAQIVTHRLTEDFRATVESATSDLWRAVQRVLSELATRR
jgi:hypothetical protein